MNDKEKLIHQLFIGKVASEIGMEKTAKLLNEAKEAFKNYGVEIPTKEPLMRTQAEQDKINERLSGH